MKVKEFKYESYRTPLKVFTQYLFKCPGCDSVHAVSTDVHTFNGDFEKPTFSPSIYKNWAPICHSFVKDGMIQFLWDCDHGLRGQTVPIPDITDDDK